MEVEVAAEIVVAVDKMDPGLAEDRREFNLERLLRLDIAEQDKRSVFSRSTASKMCRK